jgi:hypothetical protein
MERAPLATAPALAEAARRLGAPSTPHRKATTGGNPVDFCDGGAPLAADSALAETARRLGAPSTPYGKATTGRSPVDFCDGGAPLAADSALAGAARRLGAPSTPVWKATTGRNSVDFCEGSVIGRAWSNICRLIVEACGSPRKFEESQDLSRSKPHADVDFCEAPETKSRRIRCRKISTKFGSRKSTRLFAKVHIAICSVGPRYVLASR